MDLSGFGIPEKSQHDVRQAWRSWCALQSLASGKHEVRGLSLRWVGGPSLSLVDWENVRRWTDSSAPAATVALGAIWSRTTSILCQLSLRMGGMSEILLMGAHRLGLSMP